MGLILNVYRDASGVDCTNGGASATADAICVINVDGPFVPAAFTPAVELNIGTYGPTLVPVLGGARGMVGPMFGGNFATTSDSRLRQAVGDFNGAIPVFDRYETPEQYDALTR